mmetsp:Transcript_39145/g.87926  ORF Transcript_39145/g.87926 Transcript_39145/m.87926 type:complete len:255 (+) Transcript_39145:617-1381(+)
MGQGRPDRVGYNRVLSHRAAGRPSTAGAGAAGASCQYLLLLLQLLLPLELLLRYGGHPQGLRARRTQCRALPLSSELRGCLGSLLHMLGVRLHLILQLEEDVHLLLHLLLHLRLHLRLHLHLHLRQHLRCVRRGLKTGAQRCARRGDPRTLLLQGSSTHCAAGAADEARHLAPKLGAVDSAQGAHEDGLVEARRHAPKLQVGDPWLHLLGVTACKDFSRLLNLLRCLRSTVSSRRSRCVCCLCATRVSTAMRSW